MTITSYSTLGFVVLLTVTLVHPLPSVSFLLQCRHPFPFPWLHEPWDPSPGFTTHIALGELRHNSVSSDNPQ